MKLNEFLIVALGVAAGLMIGRHYRKQGEDFLSRVDEEITTIGTKRVALPKTHDVSGAWKKDYPVLTNAQGGHPYGASGLYAGAYLDEEPSIH